MYVSYCNKCFVTHTMIALGRSRRYNGTFKGHVSFISKKFIQVKQRYRSFMSGIFSLHIHCKSVFGIPKYEVTKTNDNG